ncbi:MAG: DUF2577 family protein [Cetobacterium sp.]
MIKELIQIFDQRYSKHSNWIGAVTGEVIKASPKLTIQLHNGFKIYGKKLLTDVETRSEYKREFKIKADISKQDMTVDKSDMTDVNHKHQLLSWAGTGTIEASGTITWTNDLIVGDMVLMLPTNKNEKYYLIGKVKEG